jgi:hypothetical protein
MDAPSWPRIGCGSAPLDPGGFAMVMTFPMPMGIEPPRYLSVAT